MLSIEPFIPIKPEGGGLIPDVYETTINLRRLTGLPVSIRAVILEQLPLGYIILALNVYGGTISWGVFPILTHSHHDHSSDWLDVGYFYSVDMTIAPETGSFFISLYLGCARWSNMTFYTTPVACNVGHILWYTGLHLRW